MNACSRVGGGYRRRLATVTAASGTTLVLAAGALAAPASAATLAANQACYVNVNPSQGAPMTIIGSGFNPGDTVDLSGGTVFATATASATGTIVFTTPAPELATIDPASKATTLTATDETTAGLNALITVKSANLAVLPKPIDVKHVARDKVTFSFSGFIPGKPIFGYYLRKKVVAKIKFGKPKGVCGLLRQKALLYPGGHPHNQTYTVVFEQTSRYSKTAIPRFSGRLSIFTI
jgi:hypothetical protein